MTPWDKELIQKLSDDPTERVQNGRVIENFADSNRLTLSNEELMKMVYLKAKLPSLYTKYSKVKESIIEQIRRLNKEDIVEIKSMGENSSEDTRSTINKVLEGDMNACTIKELEKVYNIHMTQVERTKYRRAYQMGQILKISSNK